MFPSLPLLYLSGFFEEHRDEYYRRLLAVSREGDWRGWLDYFLHGVRTQAQRALADTRRLLAFYETWRTRLRDDARAPKTAAGIVDEVFANPVFSISRYCARKSLAFESVRRGVAWLEKAGLFREVTGQKRHRLFVADELMRLMSDHPDAVPPLESPPHDHA